MLRSFIKSNPLNQIRVDFPLYKPIVNIILRLMNFIYKLLHIVCFFFFMWLRDSHTKFLIEFANSLKY